MAMYLNLSAQNDNLQLDQQQDNNSAPHTPLNQVDSQQSLPSITGKRKCMDKESGSSSNSGKGMRTIDPFSLMGEDSGSGKFFKRQRLDSVNSSDFSIPLTTNDETFTSSYVFLHSTVSRPASSNNNNNQNQPSSQTSYQTGYQSNNGPEEERILREEFFSQQQLPQGFLSSGGASGSFGNLAGYALPHYPVAPPQAASPYMLPSFGPPLMQAPPVPHYNNGYFPSMQAPPPDLYYPRAEQLYSRPSYPPAAMMGGGGGGGQPSSLPEEFIAETKLSKNIKKMTTVLGQIPGLEKIRWQSILQGTRSPDVGERETQRRVKEAETIGARLFGGDIDKLLGSILNQHLDFLVTYVANLKNGKKKHNKIRMQLSKVLQDAAAANNNNNNSNNNSPQSD